MDAGIHKTAGRASAPARPAAVVAVATPRVQASPLRVSSPRDPAEREAESTARSIMRMAEPTASVALPPSSSSSTAALARRAAPPSLARFADVARLMRGHGPAPFIARKPAGAAPTDAIAPGVAAEIDNQKSAGAPLPAGVRGFMETRFRADFSAVRVHTGAPAARLNHKVAAQAFTHGQHIFFGKDRFRPDAPEGRELIAHELTHTIQQGAVAQSAPVHRSADVTVTERAPAGDVHRLGISDVLDFFADKANLIPGFRMFTIVLGVNPINMAAVDRSAANILRAVVEFIPGGGLITRALDAYGIFDKGGAFIEGRLRGLGLSAGLIKQALMDFLHSLGVTDLLSPGSVWEKAKRHLSDPIERVIAFLKTLGQAILDLILDAIVRPLAALAAGTPGWDLLCAVLGKNPISGDKVPRTAETLIAPFMKLIGEEEIWENIKKGNAIARAYAWFQGALAGLMSFVQQIPGLFVSAVKALTIQDVVLVPSAFLKVGKAFAGFLAKFVSWAGGTIWDLLEIVVSVVAPEVITYIKKAQGAFRTILKNPGAFANNLVKAGKLAFSQFRENFLTHLKKSLIDWLTGALKGAAIYIPRAVSLVEIGKFVLSVLGVSWAKIRAKIVKALGPKGEMIMKTAETTVDIIVGFVKDGPTGAWEVIKEKLGNLKDMVVDAIISFAKEKIVVAAITKLVSMLNPAGAFVQAVLAIYNTVMFFVERRAQIAAVVTAFIDSIAGVASGSFAAAANLIEKMMGATLTVVLSFLARLAGLGGVADKVVAKIKPQQEKVDSALDQAIAWIKEKVKALVEKLGKKDKGDPQSRLKGAIRDANALMQGRDATTVLVRQGLGAIRERYGLTALELVDLGGHSWRVLAKINPELPSDSRKVPSPEERAAINAQAGQIAQLWTMNGVAQEFQRVGRAKRREILLDERSYRRGDNPKAPAINVGDLVEASAEPGLRRIAAATGATLLVSPTLFLVDAAGQALGGQVDQIDFLLLGAAEIRVVSAKLNRKEFVRAEDAHKLALFRSIPDNPAAFQYASSRMNWGAKGRVTAAAVTVGAAVRCRGMGTLRVDAFRSQYLTRERTKTIVIEPLHPKNQGGDGSGHTLRMTLPDLVELYIDAIKGGLG